MAGRSGSFSALVIFVAVGLAQVASEVGENPLPAAGSAGSPVATAAAALNGVWLDLQFEQRGFGRGDLIAYVRFLESADFVTFSVSLPDSVRAIQRLEGAVPPGVGESRIHLADIEVTSPGRHALNVLVRGHGGVRSLSASAVIVLGAHEDGSIVSVKPEQIPTRADVAIPSMRESSTRSALGPGDAIARPPIMTPPSSQPDPPSVRTAMSVTGCFSYIDADESQVAARNIWVRVWDDDIFFDDLLWSGVAGTDGCWSASGLNLEEEAGSGNQDIYVQYSTWTNPGGKVVDASLDYYTLSTPVTPEVATSFFDSGSWIPPTNLNYRAAYRVYAYLEEAWRFDCVRGVGQDCFSEPTVEAIVPGDDTYYRTGDDRIRIQVDGDADRSRDVVAHERGHWVMDRLLYEDSYWPPGTGGDHTWCETYNPGLAWSEGWANFYALAKGNWLNSQDTSFNYGTGDSLDIESGASCPSSVTGDANEYRVAGTLWDIWDSSSDSRDTYSTSWSTLFRVADDCPHDSLRAFYDGPCSWVSHGLARASLIFPAWQNYVYYNVSPSVTIASLGSATWLRGIVSLAATVFDPDTLVLEVRFFAARDPSPNSCIQIGISTSAPFALGWDSSSFADDATAYFCAQAYDGLELSALDVSDFSVGVDNTPPSVVARLAGTEGDAGWYLTPVTVTLSGSDATSGLANLQFQISAATRVTYTGPFAVNASGSHLLSLVGTDFAGNAYETAIPVLIDRVEPEVLVAFPAEGAIVDAGNFVFTWSGSDMESGIDHFEIRLDSGDYLGVGANTTYTFAGVPDGRHELAVKAVDVAGNVHERRVSFVVSSGQLGGGPVYWIVGAALTLVACGSILVVVRRRRTARRRRTPPDTPPR